MSRRLLKEFRVLLAPFALAIVAAVALPWSLAVRPSEGSPLILMLLGLAPLLAGVSVSLAGSAALGSEYQQRTLLLLISQPVPRLKLWSEKLLAVACVVIVMLLCELASLSLVNRWVPASAFQDPIVYFLHPGQPALLNQFFWLVIFSLTTVCSAPFFTMLARSTIGGMAFNIAAQAATVLALQGVLSLLGRPANIEPDPGILVVPGVLLYSGLFLWLGWKKFASLQIAGSDALTRTSSRPMPRALSRPAWLASRPNGASANFVRKELCLQKPAFTLSLIYCGLWVIAWLWLIAQPAAQNTIGNVLVLVTLFYILVCILLAAALTLTEEKTLGIAPWHLTLPCSVARQWALKLATGLGVAGLLAVVLPAFLGLLAALVMKPDLHNARAFEALPPLVMVILCLFSVAFWASTISTNMVRATIVTLAAALALPLWAAAGSWGANALHGMATGLLIRLASQFSWSPHRVWELSHSPAIWIVSLLLLSSIFLLQSYHQFRTTPTTRVAAGRFCLTLAMVALLSFWCLDIQRSAINVESYVTRSMAAALRESPGEPDAREMAVAELEKTVPLPSRLSHWLRSARIQIGHGVTLPGNRTRQPSGPMIGYTARILFPDQTTVAVYFVRKPAAPQ